MERRKNGGEIDWSDGDLESLEIDHALVESARAATKLKSITLRLGVEQIAEARRESERTGVPYQVVLRRWISAGAAAAQAARRASARARKRK